VRRIVVLKLLRMHAANIMALSVMSVLSSCERLDSSGKMYFNFVSVEMHKKSAISYELLFDRSDTDVGIQYKIRSNLNLAEIARKYQARGAVDAFPCEYREDGENDFSFILTDIHYNSMPLSQVHSHVNLEAASEAIDGEISRNGYVEYKGYINVDGYISRKNSDYQDHLDLRVSPIDICVNFRASNIVLHPPFETPVAVITAKAISMITR